MVASVRERLKRTPLRPPARAARRASASVARGLTPVAVQELADARRFVARYGGSRHPLRCHREARNARLDLVPADVDLASGLVVDLGANVGDWTAAVLAVAPSAHVLAVEPAPMPRARLEQRFARSPGVTIDGRAVSDTPGRAPFSLTRHSHNSSLLAPRAEMDGRYGAVGWWDVVNIVEVDVTTVDELVGERAVAVMKIDVQGMERKVLAGAARTLERTRALLLEATFVSHYDGDATFPWLHDEMTRHGFELVGISPPFVARDGAVMWVDACYRPRASQSSSSDI